MKKENKIILLICITIIINCIIVILFSTEIRKRMNFINEESDKIIEETNKENEQKADDLKNDNKNDTKEKTDDVDNNKNQSIDTNKSDNNVNEQKESSDDIKTATDDKSKSNEQNKEASDSSLDKKDHNVADSNKEKIESKLQDEYEKYKSINSDTIGYIRIEDTKIEYPVVQEDNNNEYYQYHDINKNYSMNGSIRFDSKIDSSNLNKQKNTIIIGNNPSDGSMFADLNQYKKESYAKSHPYILLQNENGLTKWKVFSVYYMNGDTETIPITFDDNQFADYIITVEKRTLFDMDTAVKDKDRILTLITDSFEYANGKTVVQAVLIENK